MRNPFISGTLSHKFFDAVIFFSDKPRTAKSLFNRCRQGFGGQDLANYILDRDAWLYENVSRPGRVLRLSDKIRVRPKREIDEKRFQGQLQNTARWGVRKDI